MTNKPFYKSKIIWLSAIPMAVEIVNLAMATPIIPVKYQGILTLISGALTIAARYTSNSKIK
jgi:hypothetical protein